MYRVRLPRQLWQLAEYVSHTFAPLTAKRGEIRIPLVEPTTHLHFKTVPLVANQIDWHAYRQVTSHGRIERNQHAFRSIGECRGTGNHPIDDRLSVFCFTGLQIGPVEPRLDKIALRINPKKPQRLAAKLSAEYERGVELMALSAKY
jgi:hypothetical protein